MLARVRSSAVLGVEAYPVEIEVDISPGLPAVVIVGLPDAAVRESRNRVKAAIKNCGYDFPSQRITVNLAPANVRKEGPSFDLPIALGILVASGQIPGVPLADTTVLGELSLDGSLRRVRGVLPVAATLAKSSNGRLVVPEENGNEAGVVRGIEVYAFSALGEVAGFVRGELDPPRVEVDLEKVFGESRRYEVDLDEVRGQENVKRGLEIAAAGGHNVILIGPPGAGKTMLTRRLPTILPDMALEEVLETSKIHSAAGLLGPSQGLVEGRPFRAPHHTASDVSLVGGGQVPRPGEISLAHNGVLFLDELPEFDRNALEALRQPLEDGAVTISRARGSVTLPARFMLVAAMNPCPCGFYGDRARECRCSPRAIESYVSRISGPLLDRIDIHIEVPAVKDHGLGTGDEGESSETVRRRVNDARRRQSERYRGEEIFCNAHLGTRGLRKHLQADAEALTFLKKAIDELGLSARAHDRILKVARTIADLAGKEMVGVEEISEAVTCRTLDRKFWM